MSKKVLVISTSLRRNSNSHGLAEEFAKGAKEAGHQVELISLIGRQIEYCVGCLSCQRTGQCVIEDDANLIAEKMLNDDVIWGMALMTGDNKTKVAVSKIAFAGTPCLEIFSNLDITGICDSCAN